MTTISTTLYPFEQSVIEFSPPVQEGRWRKRFKFVCCLRCEKNHEDFPVAIDEINLPTCSTCDKPVILEPIRSVVLSCRWNTPGLREESLFREFIPPNPLILFLRYWPGRASVACPSLPLFTYCSKQLTSCEFYGSMAESASSTALVCSRIVSR